MRIIVLGCGHIGSVVTRDLAESMPSIEVVIADKSQSRAEEVATLMRRKNVSATPLDASDHNQLVSTFRKFDLVVGALPGEVGYKSVMACIDAKVNTVDVSFMPENPLELNEVAKKAGVTVIPDCGVAPGLSHMMVGYGTSKLDQVRNAKIMVGGLPEKPVPPLGYTITWSVEGVIDEYMRDAWIVEGGKVVKVEPLSGLEEVELPSVGKLEAFNTDGLRSLLHTVKGVDSMCEKTLRYLGHVEKIRLLKDLGFFDERPLQFENMSVSPRKVTAKMFEKKLKKPDMPDITVMRVQVDGVKSGKRVMHSFDLLERSDKRSHISAMARCTGFTASCVAQLLAKKAITEKGVIPPEKLGMNQSLYRKVTGMLRKRGIEVKESKKTLH